MHRFIHGEERMQQALLPPCLEDYVSEENPVRAMEVFIDELDLAALPSEPKGCRRRRTAVVGSAKGHSPAPAGTGKMRRNRPLVE